jgi:hypothetical protein
MALLMDGFVGSIEDVVRVDSGVSDVARAEGISIDHKLKLAQGDCELKISQFVVNHGLESKLGSLNNLPRLDRVVVSDGLKRWFCLHTLQLFYSDAYVSVLNDRYGKKFQHFKKLACEAWERYIDTGIACVYNPIPRGQISRIDINQVPIGVGTYYAAIAWIDSAGNAGSLSEVAVISVGAGEGFTIVPGVVPSGATGYDIYVAEAMFPLWKQNGAPIEANSAYSAGVIVTGNGNPVEPMQAIDFVLRKSRMFTRG